MRAALRADLFTGKRDAVAPGAPNTARGSRDQPPYAEWTSLESTFVYLIRIAARLMSNGTI